MGTGCGSTFQPWSSVETPSLWKPCLHSSSIASQSRITPFWIAADWWSSKTPLKTEAVPL